MRSDALIENGMVAAGELPSFDHLDEPERCSECGAESGLEYRISDLHICKDCMREAYENLLHLAALDAAANGCLTLDDATQAILDYIADELNIKEEMT